MGLSKEPQLAAPSQANLSKNRNSPRRQKWGTSEAAMQGLEPPKVESYAPQR
jgi:hypothetical protein